MKRSVLAVCLMLVCSSIASAALPTGLEQFQDQVKQQATDPQAAVGLWFDAVHVYLSGDQATGLAMIRELTLPGNWDNPTSAFMFALDDKPHISAQLRRRHNPRRRLPDGPAELPARVLRRPRRPQPYADQPEGVVRQALRGLDRCRRAAPHHPARKGDDGLYRLWEFSSVYVDCRPPTPPLDESIPQSKDPQWVHEALLRGRLHLHRRRPRRGRGDHATRSPRRKALGNSPAFPSTCATGRGCSAASSSGTSPETNYEFDKANWELNYAEPIREVGPGEETRAVLQPLRRGLRQAGLPGLRRARRVPHPRLRERLLKLPPAGQEGARHKPRRQQGPHLGHAPLLRGRLHLHRRQPR